jgi:superoxide dismutase
MRSKYIDAFFSNIDWEVVNKYFSNAAAIRSAA